jgi:UDP-N-acetylmuramoyl-tripeptide--D-alanyl-D-alanine ligase
VRGWTPEKIAAAAGARQLRTSRSGAGPERVTIDSREAGPGVLFVGLPGVNVDGGSFAAQALNRGAWGALVSPQYADPQPGNGSGVLLVADDPLAALQRLAAYWRAELGATVIGVTGSTGKTTTKDILLALLAPHKRAVASRANYNTEIGLPLEILAAPAETEVLVLEHAMRGAGQIAELAAISRPDIGVIVNVGPVHLELLGSIEAIAAAKAELLDALPPGGVAVVPAGERLLDVYLRDDFQTIRFGAGGDVSLTEVDGERVVIDLAGERTQLELPFTQAHLRANLLAAVGAARAAGVTPRGRVEVAFSPARGQRVKLPGDVTLIDDSYNANPMSMRAALDDLSDTASRIGAARRVAVLGDMLELGAGEKEFHTQIGEHARDAGVDVLITVGELGAAIGEAFDGEVYPVADAGEAAALVPELLEPGDVILIKASNGVGLQLVADALIASGR